jgi:hypothetical protein
MDIDREIQNILNLPLEMIYSIFNHFDISDLARLCQTNKQLQYYAKEFVKYKIRPYIYNKYEKMSDEECLVWYYVDISDESSKLKNIKEDIKIQTYITDIDDMDSFLKYFGIEYIPIRLKYIRHMKRFVNNLINGHLQERAQT